jgi:hypothetical protein
MAKKNVRKGTGARNLKARKDADLRDLIDWGNSWSLQLNQLNLEVKKTTSCRAWAAREYVARTGEQLVGIGETEGSSTALLMGSLCNELRVMIGRPETKESLRALRLATNAIKKAIPAEITSTERLLMAPAPKERSRAAIVWRDNIAQCLTTRGDVPTKATAVARTLSVAVGVLEFFGSRFLVNEGKLSLNSREVQWAKEAERVLSRADLSTPEGRTRAATRIVKQCAEVEGMTATQAKNLFKSDGISLSGKQQVKRVRSRT